MRARYARGFRKLLSLMSYVTVFLHPSTMSIISLNIQHLLIILQRYKIFKANPNFSKKKCLWQVPDSCQLRIDKSLFRIVCYNRFFYYFWCKFTNIIRKIALYSLKTWKINRSSFLSRGQNLWQTNDYNSLIMNDLRSQCATSRSLILWISIIVLIRLFLLVVLQN